MNLSVLLEDGSDVVGRHLLLCQKSFLLWTTGQLEEQRNLAAATTARCSSRGGERLCGDDKLVRSSCVTLVVKMTASLPTIPSPDP